MTDELLDAVTEMRRLQRAWFGGDRNPETLRASKAAEKKVDRLLDALKAGPPPQGSLFVGGSR